MTLSKACVFTLFVVAIEGLVASCPPAVSPTWSRLPDAPVADPVVAIYDGKLYILGPNADLHMELHAYDISLESWADLSTPASGNIPLYAGHHRNRMTASGGKLFVFGGLLSPGERILNWFHEYDISSATWTRLGEPWQGATPSPRHDHGMAEDSGKVFVHGGRSGRHGDASDLHVYNPSSQSWIDLTRPVSGFPPRARACNLAWTHERDKGFNRKLSRGTLKRH
mmetsp:Transcript_5082/g.9719  ORF Transcript_5082/g.9719 Transcript_5082/m.9719 type:complete len:225 (+) Transcript_5082:48-722(+)